MAEISSARLSIDVRLLPEGSDKRVLDVGCGSGRHILEAARRECIAVGVDYDAAQVRAARTQSQHQRIDWIVADATRLPFRGGVFDAVICTETLEHLPDDRRALAEISRVMKTGGRLLGAVPSHFTELVYWRLSWDYWHTAGGHVRIYEPRHLQTALTLSGLSLRTFGYVHFIDSLFWLRYCAVDWLRRRRVATAYEQAIALAVASEQRLPGWRAAVRERVATSRLIRLVDTVGAFVWPKSLTFVAEKLPPSVEGGASIAKQH